MSQRELAKKAELELLLIKRIEAGEEFVTDEHIEKLAAGLDFEPFSISSLLSPFEAVQ